MLPVAPRIWVVRENQMSNELNGKFALVTGGSRGIGAATAKELAARGATVMVNYAGNKSAADAVVDEIASRGGKAIAVQADVSEESGVVRLFDAIDQNFGGQLDILVNNAGIYETGAIQELGVEHFDKTMRINVRAVFLVTHAATQRLRDGGRIITTGSCIGDSMPFPGGAVYAMSKSAVQGLTRGWARDLGPRGITVNCVQPGPIDTDMNPDNEANNPGAMPMRSMTALGRYGKAEEVAALIGFLAGPTASYLTGSMLTVDGGFNA